MKRLILLTASLIAMGAFAAPAQAGERFLGQIQAFEASDRKLPPPPGGVLMVGSSSFRGWRTAAEDLAPYPILNRGFGGSTNADAIHYFDRIVKPYEPRVILYYEGDNDIANGQSPEKVARVFKTFYDRVREHLPETRVVFLSIKPSSSRKGVWSKMQQANAYIRQLADREKHLYYCDVTGPLLKKDGSIDDSKFLDDRLHLKRETYPEWAACVRPVLDKAWKDADGPSLTLDRKLKNNEKIVFLGDSLTNQTLPNGGFVFNLMDILRKAHPDTKLDYERVGIAMATAPKWDSDLLKFQVLRHEPTLSVVYIGTADMIGFFGQREGGTLQHDFRKHLTNIVTRLKASGSDVILITPALLGEEPDPERKGMRYLTVYAGIVRDVANAQDVPVVDLHWAFNRYLNEHKKDDARDGLVTTDGVHFNETGQALVIQNILACLKVAPPEEEAAKDE